MTWLEGTAVEIILFALIWAVWSYTTRHLSSFFDLRLRIRKHLQRMADTGQPHGVPEGSIRRAEVLGPEPAGMCRNLGYEMLLFVEKAPKSARLAQLMRFDPIRAGDDLISLAYDGRFAFRRGSIASALRFKDDTDPAA
jgi:hypothetical protein